MFETALSSIHIVGTALRTTRIGMAVFPCTELWHYTQYIYWHYSIHSQHLLQVLAYNGSSCSHANPFIKCSSIFWFINVWCFRAFSCENIFTHYQVKWALTMINVQIDTCICINSKTRGEKIIDISLSPHSPCLGFTFCCIYR